MVVVADYGRTVRMCRLVAVERSRPLLFAMDDAVYAGPRGRLRAPAQMLELMSTRLLRPSALLANIGFFERFVSSSAAQGRVCSLSLSSPTDVARKYRLSSVPRAVHEAMDAVAVHLSTDCDEEAATVQLASDLVAEARSLGVPVLVAAYSRPTRAIGTDHTRAVRIALEIGADIIKTGLPIEQRAVDDLVASSSGVPLVFAGGAFESDDQTVAIIRRVATLPSHVGLCLGRTISEATDLERIVSELREFQERR